MKKAPQRQTSDGFWHRFLNPITMMPDRARDKRLKRTRKIP